MSSHREQAHIDAPVESVWGLVGSPDRYPDWWPRIVEVRGESFEEGDEFVQVIHTPSGQSESAFLLERVDDMREIRMSCQLTGTFAHWKLTPAQGGTFVDLEMGMEPIGMRNRVFDIAAGRLYFRSWSQKSLEALSRATSGTAPPSA